MKGLPQASLFSSSTEKIFIWLMVSFQDFYKHLWYYLTGLTIIVTILLKIMRTMICPCPMLQTCEAVKSHQISMRWQIIGLEINNILLKKIMKRRDQKAGPWKQVLPKVNILRNGKPHFFHLTSSSIKHNTDKILKGKFIG